MPELTPFQTIGPFFDLALCTPGDTARLAAEGASGVRIIIEGTVTDGAGIPAPDALIEVWQANAFGRYDHPEADHTEPLDSAFDGFGRAPTNDAGRFRIETIKPGRVIGPGETMQAPHLVVGILARGLLTRLVTRAYFDDEPSNADDPVLSLVPPARRHTLIANRVAADRYRFDIVLQGDEAHETVFFDV